MVQTFVYISSHVSVPSFLFTIGTVTGVIVTFLTFLRLTSFLVAFCFLRFLDWLSSSFSHKLEQGLHEGYALITPRLLVGLLGLRGLPAAASRGLPLLS